MMITKRKIDAKLCAKQTPNFLRRFKAWFGIGLALLLVAVIFFQIAFDDNLIIAGRYFLAQADMAAGVGASASVPQNPFNSLVQQFQEREQMLSEKEKELQQKDAALQEQANGKHNNQNWFLVVLLILVLLNFYLDYRRRKYSTNDH